MVRRIRSFVSYCAALLVVSAPTFANTAVTLQLDVVDPTHYGNKHPDPFVRITASLNISFTTVEPGQATLFLTAYDIDYSDEVLVTLPDGSTTFLNAPINSNQHSPDVAVPLGNLAAGTHAIAIQNNRDPNYKWGVSDLRVTRSGESVSGDHALALVIELGCDPGQLIVATTLGFECAEGAQGPEGPQGVLGADGINGSDGAAGIAGSNGEDGVNGADGKDGEVGAQGPAGPPGQSPEMEDIIAAVVAMYCGEGGGIVRLTGGILGCESQTSTQCPLAAATAIAGVLSDPDYIEAGFIGIDSSAYCEANHEESGLVSLMIGLSEFGASVDLHAPTQEPYSQGLSVTEAQACAVLVGCNNFGREEGS